MKLHTLIGFAAALAAISPHVAQAADAAYDELVAAERAFAADSAPLGVTAAFAKHMAPDAVLYRPTPVEARVVYAKAASAPRPPIALAWGPSHAEIAVSGDMGYTFGPARFDVLEGAEDRDGKPVPASTSYTVFFSIWTRDADGKFVNRLDQGVAYPGKTLATDVVRLGPAQATDVATRATPADTALRLQQLVQADRLLSAALATAGADAALKAARTPDAYVLRDGVGAVPAAQAPVQQKIVGTELAAIRLSAAADLGATSGWGGDQKTPYTYQRAWRWTGSEWKVAVDLVAGGPPPA